MWQSFIVKTQMSWSVSQYINPQIPWNSYAFKTNWNCEIPLELRCIISFIFLRVQTIWNKGSRQDQDNSLSSNFISKKLLENCFILCSACVDLRGCLWDQHMLLLVDSFSWRTSTRYSGQLTLSIYLTTTFLLSQLQNPYHIKCIFNEILPSSTLTLYLWKLEYSNM